MAHNLVDDAFVARSSESHTREFRLRSYRWSPAANQPTMLGLTLPGGKTVTDIPIETGELVMDATDPHRRSLRVAVPGEEWIPDTPDHPCAPFGQFLVLHVRIDMPDGQWSPWLKLGEFPIVSHQVDRPDGMSEITATDWSARVNEFGFVNNHSWKGRSRVEAIKQVVDEALPARLYAVKASANADKNLTEEQGQITAGTGRWDFVQHVCELAALEAFFDRAGDLIIRNAVVDYEGYVPGAGPDIGTVTNPVARLVEGPNGNIEQFSASVTRENAANAVWVTAKPTQAAPPKGQRPAGYSSEQYKPKTIGSKTVSGPAAYGDQFGRITLHRDREYQRLTRDVMRDAQMWADHLRSRRQGVIRRITLDCLPMWWLDPDDKVTIRWRQRMPDSTERIRDEAHMVERIVLPLEPSGRMQITCRQVAVIELSEPWTPEPEPDPDWTPPPDEPTTPNPGLPPVLPEPVLPPATDLLARYRSEITANPSTYATHREYGRVTNIVDGDTFDVTVYSDAACTKPGSIKHPNGNSYGSMRIRMIGIQAPEAHWTWGPSATAHLRSVLAVGDRVRLRSDGSHDATHGSTVRIWREAYKAMPDGSWVNLQLAMIDAGWAFAFPLSDEPRNQRNRVAHMKVAMWHGLGMFAQPSTKHGDFRLTVNGNPSGADKPSTEYATIKNVSGAASDISGWLFGDPSPISSKWLPAGAVIPPGGSARVTVGKGADNNTTRRYYMDLSHTLWNNSVDVAILHDQGTRVVEVTQVLGGVTCERIPIKPTTATPVSDRVQVLDFPGIGG